MPKNHPDPMMPEGYRIQRVTRETEDTFTMTLVPERKTKAPAFRPGQFNMLYVLGAGESAISLSGDPNERSCFTHTIRAVGNVTKLLQKMRPGDVVGVRGPYGNPWPVEEAKGKDVVVVAGGIGLAPLRPVLYSVLRSSKKFGRVSLLYGARTPDDILFARELKTWNRAGGLDIHITVDRAQRPWTGPVGVVTTLIPRLTLDPARTLVMICGPEVMMRFTVASLKERGVRAQDIYVSMERNMKCAVGFCGHCQYGPHFICKDGPVFRFDRVEEIFRVAEI